MVYSPKTSPQIDTLESIITRQNPSFFNEDEWRKGTHWCNVENIVSPVSLDLTCFPSGPAYALSANIVSADINYPVLLNSKSLL